MENVKILIETAQNLKEFTEGGIYFKFIQVGEGERNGKPAFLLNILALKDGEKIEVNNPFVIVNPPKYENTEEYLKNLIYQSICRHIQSTQK